MNWRPWRRELEQSRKKVCEAERLLDEAKTQQRRVEALTPRVDAAADRLERLHRENHFGPMIEAILRGHQ